MRVAAGSPGKGNSEKACHIRGTKKPEHLRRLDR